MSHMPKRNQLVIPNSLIKYKLVINPRTGINDHFKRMALNEIRIEITIKKE
jgi:hypothetical protein